MMTRWKFTEEQMVAILREQGAGAKTAEVSKKHGVSTATFCAWKAKSGGMEVSDAKRLKALEDESAQLKRLLAYAMLLSSTPRSPDGALRGRWRPSWPAWAGPT